MLAVPMSIAVALDVMEVHEYSRKQQKRVYGLPTRWYKSMHDHSPPVYPDDVQMTLLIGMPQFYTLRSFAA